MSHYSSPRFTAGFGGLLFALLTMVSLPGTAAADVKTQAGVLPDGSPWRIDMPDNWNGAVLVNLDYAGGNDMANNPRSRLLLERGYALAGTNRAKTGWNVKASVENLAGVVKQFRELYGKARLTLAFGQSLGGHTAFGAVELRPDLFDGGVAMCGAPAGIVAMWNGKMDALFIVRTLLAPGSNVPLIHYPADQAKTVLPRWREVLEAAQRTPGGRARIALAATLAQLPAWSVPSKQQPASSDDDALEDGLYDSLAAGPLPLLAQYGGSRFALEQLGGGNFSFNTGVDYASNLHHLRGAQLVERLYQKAGLNLRADLDALASAPRIAPEYEPIAALSYQIYGARLKRPVITLHASGDQISPPDTTSALDLELRAHHKQALVRQVYTNAAGHCPFSPAEVLAVTERLVHRIQSGRWEPTDAATLNLLAASYASGETRFIPYLPEPFLRPFGLRDLKSLATK